jgi:riboflavin-specific deaminase-like protein
MRATRPKVLCNMAPSLDGKIAPARKRAPFVMSRHPEDPRRMHDLRARADAVLIGATNLRADDPDLMPSRLRIVVTGQGEGIEPGARMFHPSLGGEAVVVHSAAMPTEKRKRLAPVATLLELGAERVDLSRLLEWLVRERQCQILLCEGGGELNADLFAARAVDVMHLTIVPRLLGGKLAPGVVGGAGFDPDQVPDPQLAACDRVGDELFLEYRFAWPEPEGRSRR